MKPRLFWLISAAIASFVFGALSRGAERFDYQVRNDFFAGFTGNAEAMARAMKTTETILAENPNHAEALVWHGAGVYFQAGKAFRSGDSEKGMELAEKGIGEMDKAVQIAPDDIGVRVPRGSVLLTATRFQQGPHVEPLIQRGLSDFQHVYELQSAQLSTMPSHPKGELLFGLADANNRLGKKDQAKIFYERAAAELPGTPYERNAQEWLASGQLSAQQSGCLGCHTGK